MEVENTSKWPMETNINPHLQGDELTQVDPKDPNHVIKIDK